MGRTDGANTITYTYGIFTSFEDAKEHIQNADPEHPLTESGADADYEILEIRERQLNKWEQNSGRTVLRIERELFYTDHPDNPREWKVVKSQTGWIKVHPNKNR